MAYNLFKSGVLPSRVKKSCSCMLLLCLCLPLLSAQHQDSILLSRINLKKHHFADDTSNLTTLVKNLAGNYNNAESWYSGAHKYGYNYPALLDILNSRLKTKVFEEVLYLEFICVVPENALSYQWLLVEEWKFPDEYPAQQAFKQLEKIHQSRIFFKYPIYWTFMQTKSSIIYMHSNEMDQNEVIYSDLINLIARSTGCDIEKIIKYRS